MKKKISILLVSLLFLNSCADNQIYVGSVIGHSVNGDSNSVTVMNIWNAQDGLPLADIHCVVLKKEHS